MTGAVGRVWRRWIGQLTTRVILLAVLAGCGSAQGTPTPLPAAVVRPAQPTPAYAVSTAFTLLTPTIVLPTVAVSPMTAQANTGEEMTPVAPALSLVSAPIPALTGVGIVRGGAVLLTAPNGAVRQQLPAGAVVTVTGKSADGAWVAAYDEQGTSGWLAAQQLLLLGTETLTVVTTAAGPGLAATLVAQAMEPLAMPTIVLTSTLAP